MNITATRLKSTSRSTQGYLICITSTVVWSSTAVFIRYLNDAYRLPSLVLAFWRDALVFVALATVFALANRARLSMGRSHLRFLVLYGFILAIFNSLWTVSVALNGAGVSTVLAYSSAAFTAILGWRLFGERLGPVKVLAILFSILGCAFVSGALDRSAWQVNPVGIITGLLSGMAFAAYSLMGKASAERGLNPWTALLYTFGFAALFLLAINLLPGWLPGAPKPPSLFWLGGAFVGWIVLAVLAIGPTIGGYGLYTLSLTYLPASVANLIATLEPAMTALLAYLLLGERFTGPQLLGSVMIISGVILLRVSEGRLLESRRESPAVSA